MVVNAAMLVMKKNLWIQHTQPKLKELADFAELCEPKQKESQ